MGELRDHLRALLARKIESHGLVLWEDPECEYAGVVEGVLPEGTRVLRWDGSWYRLRRELEPLVSGPEPPRLVVYQPVQTPPKEDDPLAEVRDSGTSFRIRLRTLLKDALGGTLTEARIAELAQARTVEEAEAALGGGVGTGVRLPAVVGTTDTLQLCLRILADDVGAALSGPELWEEARGALRHGLGGEPTGEGDLLRDAVFRHLVLLELEGALGRLPPELEGRRGAASSEQRRRATELLRTWRADLRRLGSYRERALRAEADLDLRGLLSWDDRLSGLDSVPLIEELAFRRVLELLSSGDLEAASRLADARRTGSMWAQGYVPEGTRWAPLWEAVAALVDLRLALEANPVPSGTASSILDWYAEEGWRVDRAHRRMESILLDVPTGEGLDPAIAEARGEYERWLEQLLEGFTGTLERGGFEPGLRRQSEVHKAEVAPARERTAYVLVDALRYELGLELAEALRRDHPEVDVTAAVASAPTITPVGMASLMPGAELGVRLELSGSESLEVLVEGNRIRGVPERLALLRAAHGEVADLTLSDVLESDERALADRIDGVKLVVLRSQEIDEAFESGEMAAWAYVKTLRDLLARAVARLRAAGIERFVLAADHGFLILSREVGSSRVIERPGGRGVLHRRCWIGEGGRTSASTIRVPLEELGVDGGLDLIVPRGLAIFATGGARRFFHGGLSPQELLIPVIAVRTAAAASASSTVRVEVVGGRITTGVFSAAVALDPNLFAGEAVVRIRARDRAGKEVARVVAGQGYEEATGALRLQADLPAGAQQIATLQVMEGLAKGDRVILEVYDSKTDRLLGKSKPAEVATEVRVGDDLV
jgi:hypothetical protein